MLRNTCTLHEAVQHSDRGPMHVGTLCPRLSSPSHIASSTRLVGNGHRSSFHPVPGPCGWLAWLADKRVAVTAIETAQDCDSIVPALRKLQQTQDPSGSLFQSNPVPS